MSLVSFSARHSGSSVELIGSDGITGRWSASGQENGVSKGWDLLMMGRLVLRVGDG